VAELILTATQAIGVLRRLASKNKSAEFPQAVDLVETEILKLKEKAAACEELAKLPAKLKKPTPRETQILRRLSLEGRSLLVTKTQDGDTYSYENGEPVWGFGDSSLRKFRAAGWVIPVPGETLLEGVTPQRYVFVKQSIAFAAD
jgi:hypothetical protein